MTEDGQLKEIKMKTNVTAKEISAFSLTPSAPLCAIHFVGTNH